MKKILVVFFVLLFFCSCLKQPPINVTDDENMNTSSIVQDDKTNHSTSSDEFISENENFPDDSSQNDIQENSQPAAVFDIYQYDNLPDFPIPYSNIIPEKITYYKEMLGETDVFVDTNQINQIMALLKKVQIKNNPSPKKADAELHQVISFYKNINDEKPIYILYFFVDTLCIETNGIKSDMYTTLNWINEGNDDESKINVQFRKMISSWAKPSYPSD